MTVAGKEAQIYSPEVQEGEGVLETSATTGRRGDKLFSENNFGAYQGTVRKTSSPRR